MPQAFRCIPLTSATQNPQSAKKAWVPAFAGMNGVDERAWTRAVPV